MEYNTLIKIAKKNNGIITTEAIEKAGIPRVYLTRMVTENKIQRIGRGFYIFSDTPIDYFVLYSFAYQKMIYSRRTALYLNNLSNQQFDGYEGNFPRSYNVSNVSKDIKCFRVSGIRYDLGKTEVISPFGNKVTTYDKERSLCDIFLYDFCDLEEVRYAFKEYQKYKPNPDKLFDYAKKLKVLDKVKSTYEALL